MTTSKIGFYCKTFRPDFDHLSVMLDSFAQNNPDGLRLTLSLPRDDKNAFHDRFGHDIPQLRLVHDEDYCPFDLRSMSGWHAQQLCKLSSWRAVDAEQNVILDSDFYFIRPVRAAELLPRDGKEFVVYGSLIRTVFSDRDNSALLAYLEGAEPRPDWFPQPRPAPETDFSEIKALLEAPRDSVSPEERSGAIFRLFGAKRWYFYQPGQIYSKTLLVALEQFLAERGLNFAQAISASPWENNWYGEYIAAMHAERIDFRVSPVFHVAKAAQVEAAKQAGLTEEKLATRFAWIAMAARHIAMLKY